MDWSAHNAEFVMVSYALTAVCLLAVAIYIVAKDRARTQALKNIKN